MSVATSTCDAAGLEVGERARCAASGSCCRGSRSPRCRRVSSCSASRLAPCLVRVNTSAWSIRPRLDEVAEQLALAVAVDRVDDLRRRARPAVLRGATSTGAGSSSSPSASARISSENVAENSRFWRRVRQQREDAADVADEAHVEHPVGLVEHEDLDLRQVDGALAERGRAGGRAWRRGSRRRARSARICGLDADAAVDRRSERIACWRRRCGRSRRPGARARGSASRISARMARGRARRSGARRASRCSIGSTNAAVLPVPVWAPASRSRPSSTSGIARAGRGWVV